MKLPIISIVGQPNVGKSTFFNRLTGYRKAIVNQISGVTRDRNYGFSDWNGINFILIDTGGYIYKTKNFLDTEIQKQTFLSIKESNIIIFIVDINYGINDTDKKLAKIIRSFKKPTLLMINKVDNIQLINYTFNFFKLGFKKYYYVSSNNGYGTGEILDDIVLLISKLNLDKKKYIINNNKPKFSIVGKPNAGKSTLINSLLGNSRTIVSEIPGTTRDSIDTYYNKFGFNCILTDTSGIRKKNKVYENIEFYSTLRAIKSIKNSDVCFLILDVINGWSLQDMKIAQLIIEKGKGLVIVINKWDLLESKYKIKIYENIIRSKILPLYDIPIIFLSKKYKKGLFNLINLGFKIFLNRKKRIKTNLLNNFLLPIVESIPPHSVKGKIINIKYCTQIPFYNPCFLLFSNHPNYIKDSYKKFIEKKIRNKFDFNGVPITIFFRKK